jgi:hypothetical protein
MVEQKAEILRRHSPVLCEHSIGIVSRTSEVPKLRRANYALDTLWTFNIVVDYRFPFLPLLPLAFPPALLIASTFCATLIS